MLVSGMNQTRQASTPRVSSRKHPRLDKQPAARNAIIRDRETGTYQATVDPLLAETVAGLRLRMNALELTVSRLMRDGAVERGYAHPLVAPKAATNVVPMDVARAKKEQSKAVQALPVSGNEAEALLLEQPVELALPAPEVLVPEVVTPTEGEYVVDESKIVKFKQAPVSNGDAANDDLHSPEVIANLNAITDESVEDLNSLALQYGMDLSEASEILYKEYSRRELHCQQHHGKSRVEVRLVRTLRQRGVVDQRLNFYERSLDSKFLAWSSGVTVQRVTPDFVVSSHRSPLVPGEAVARTRERELLKDEMRTRIATHRGSAPRRAKFRAIEKTSNQLVTLPPVTTDSQIKAIGAWWGAVRDRAGKLMGFPDVPRSYRKRMEYANDVDPNADLLAYPKLTHYRGRNKMSEFTHGTKMRVLTSGGVSPSAPWSDQHTVQERIVAISKECMKRGIHTPLDMTVFIGMIGDHVDKATAEMRVGTVTMTD